MGNNNTNFKAMSTEAIDTMRSFSVAMISLAQESNTHKDTNKDLQNRLAVIRTDRKKAMDDGMSTDDAVVKFSTLEVENLINAEDVRYKAACEPLRATIKECYTLVPENLEAAYQKYIKECKRGDFLDCIDDFLANIGIEVTNAKGAKTRKLSDIFAARIGAKIASSKAIVEDGNFTTSMKKGQFNKMFLAVFADILKEQGVL